MKRLILTIHPGGIHVDEQNAGATEQQNTVQYLDRNWRPVGDFKSFAEVEALVQRAQQDTGAAHAVNNIARLGDDLPPEAA